MSLRTKFLSIFIALGALPLLTLGVLSYRQSTKALEDLLAARTGAIASRAGGTLAERYARSLSDLMFLANNAETQRLLGATSRPNAPLHDSTHAEILGFLDAAWGAVGSSWSWVEIRDTRGAVIHRLGDSPSQPESFRAGDPLVSRLDYLVTRPIAGPGTENNTELGSIRGSLLLQEVLPRGELSAGLGEFGYSVVVDRASDRVLFHPRVTGRRQSLNRLLGPNEWDLEPESLTQSNGRFEYSEDGTERIASFISLDDPPWTIISSESLDEFAAPFARTGTFNLLIVLLVTATITTAFLVLTRRATDSLNLLTDAADEMAGGNMDPPLPPGGGDEVGRLSAAFSIMVNQVRSMLRRVEESRHMSAIGEFAAQLSHEIRNPLTSIKLNLQRLDRGVKDAKIPEEFSKAVQLSLKEANRLDGTVRGVLSISRTKAPQRDPESLHEILRSALDALSPQMEAEEIRVETELSAEHDTVLGDRELLKGAFLNLFLNSVEVMDCGGTLRVLTANAGGERGAGEPLNLESSPRQSTVPIHGRRIFVQISDDGPGVPEDLRNSIFDPFFTTKEGGSGFGLPLAVRVMEEHSGTLTLAEVEPSRKGAAFHVVLPLVVSGRKES
jgi:signal transduction histidine kinase